jgi:exonuclease VII large subunit
LILHADNLAEGMCRTINGRIERQTERLQGRYDRLAALSPFDVLSRGYAIIETENAKAVSSALRLLPGEDVVARFRVGRVSMQVKEVSKNGE